MKKSIFAAIGTLILVGCVSQKKEAETEYDLTMSNIKHGLIFGPPVRTRMMTRDMSSVKRGEAVFKRRCEICHGVRAEGNGAASRSLKTNPANLRKLAKQFPDHHFFIQISKGRGEMPNWENLLSDRDLWDLTNYIQSLARGN